MADDEKKIEEVEETAETTPEPEAAETPAAVAEETDAAEAPADDEAVTEPPADEAAEAAPAAAPKTKSRRHVPRAERRQRSKPKREGAATRKPISRPEKPEAARGRRQERRGVVVSSAGDKTIVVKVDVIKSHPRYKKVVRRTVKFHAHDERNTAGVGDTVRIVETRPLSKTKRWRLAEIVEKAR
jgi:small subunit ribosomal protein S17